MHPTVSEYLNGEAAEYFDIIREALQIIRQYESGERIYEIAEASEDCIRLAAMHSHVAEMVGYLQGMASRTESERKVARSKYAMDIKATRDAVEDSGSAVKITESEVDHAARHLSDDEATIARDMEVISRMITSAWYSISDFITVLTGVCNRASREHQV